MSIYDYEYGTNPRKLQPDHKPNKRRKKESLLSEVFEIFGD